MEPEYRHNSTRGYTEGDDSDCVAERKSYATLDPFGGTGCMRRTTKGITFRTSRSFLETRLNAQTVR